MYRSVFVLVILGILGLPALFSMEFVMDPLSTKCANEQGLNTDFMRNHITNISESDLHDPTIKCLVNCMWHGIGLVKKDGSLNLTAFDLKLPNNIPNRNNIIREFDECSNEKGNDRCDTTANFMICLYHKPAFRASNPPGVRL